VNGGPTFHTRLFDNAGPPDSVKRRSNDAAGSSCQAVPIAAFDVGSVRDPLGAGTPATKLTPATDRDGFRGEGLLQDRQRSRRDAAWWTDYQPTRRCGRGSGDAREPDLRTRDGRAGPDVDVVLVAKGRDRGGNHPRVALIDVRVVVVDIALVPQPTLDESIVEAVEIYAVTPLSEIVIPMFVLPRLR